VTPFPATSDTKNGKLAADAMLSCPKTHDLDTAVQEIRAFFEDEHVHMALIVATDRRLVTTIERPDLFGTSPALSPAAELGTLAGRTARPAQPLDVIASELVRDRRRRLAVVDECGRLVGLLCLKQDGSGYCSDDNVRERQSTRYSRPSVKPSPGP
jgi:CBS-domain-containing membrane protein